MSSKRLTLVPVALPKEIARYSSSLLSVSGYLGGLMVYDQGIGIARISKKKWREIAQRGNAHVPEQKQS